MREFLGLNQELLFLAHPEVTVSYLTHTQIQQNAQHEKFLPVFDADLQQQNLTRLQELQALYVSPTIVDSFLQRLMMRVPAFAEVFRDLPDMPAVRDTLSQEFLSSGRHLAELPGTSSEIDSKVLERLMYGSGKTTFLAGTHAYTFLFNVLARSFTRAGDIGVLSFDQHIDAYDYGDGGTYDKSNVHRQMLSIQLGSLPPIRAVGVVGAAALEYRGFYFGGHSSPHVNRSHQLHFSKPEFRNRFATIPEDSYHDQGVFNPTTYEDNVRKTVRAMALAGAKQLYFDVDIDVVKGEEGPYTAMDYSPFNDLLALGCMDLKFFHEKYMRRVNRIRGNEQARARVATEMLNELFVLTSELKSPSKKAAAIRNAYIHGAPAWGLSEHALLEGLSIAADEGRKRNMSIGVVANPESGSRVMGGVVEVCGKDYQHRTAGLVRRVIDHINGLE